MLVKRSYPLINYHGCQVMYPITAGGGQGGSFQTPGIKQGCFVFGFFLDGSDEQVPIIMGVLGNNAKTIIGEIKRRENQILSSEQKVHMMRKDIVG